MGKRFSSRFVHPCVIFVLAALTVPICIVILTNVERAYLRLSTLMVDSRRAESRRHEERPETVDKPSSPAYPFRSARNPKASDDIVVSPDDKLQRLFLQHLHIFPCFRKPCNATFTPEEERLKRMLRYQYPIIEPYRRVIDSLTDHSPYADIVFILAASSNHFEESRGVLGSMRLNIFPALRNMPEFSFKVIYYDLGLDRDQIVELQMVSEITAVIPVPFEQLPKRFENLFTCGWKPLVILANAHHSKVTIWMDASTRFFSSNITMVLHHALDKGVYVVSNYHLMPRHVAAPALRYFHVQPCLLSGFKETAGGLLAFKNDPVIRRAVLGPWVSCAFSPECLCPGEDCYNRLKQCKGPGPYSVCHRFDQATLGAILVALYDWRASSFYGTRIARFARREHAERQSLAETSSSSFHGKTVSRGG